MGLLGEEVEKKTHTNSKKNCNCRAVTVIFWRYRHSGVQVSSALVNIWCYCKILFRHFRFSARDQLARIFSPMYEKNWKFWGFVIKSLIVPMRFHPIRVRKARWVPFCNVYLFTNLLSILLYVVPFYKIKYFHIISKRSLLLGKRYQNYWLFHYFDYRFQNWNK